MFAEAKPVDDPNKIFHMRFEKQSNSLLIGTQSGFRLVNYDDPDKLKVKRGLESDSICLIELIPRTKILVYVTSDLTRKVNLYDYSIPKNISEPKFYSSSVVCLRASITRIAIAVEDGIFLYSSVGKRFMDKLHHIKLESPNLDGLCDLSEHEVNTYIAYPFESNSGKLQIFDANIMKSKITIDAHDNPLVAITFSPTGRSVATASEKGTLIRVHIVFTGDCIYEFRRGLTRHVAINSLGFGLDSTYLSVTSSSETIHIFKLEHSASVAANPPNWIMDALQRTSEAYLPTNISKMLSQERSFAFAKLPVSQMETISTVHKKDDDVCLLVATTDGLIYKYDINPTAGGECALVRAVTIEKETKDPLPNDWVLV